MAPAIAIDLRWNRRETSATSTRFVAEGTQSPALSPDHTERHGSCGVSSAPAALIRVIHAHGSHLNTARQLARANLAVRLGPTTGAACYTDSL